MSPTELVKKKIVLLGDGAVGKTSLVRRFVIDKFSDDYIATIGTKVTKKDLRIMRGESPVELTMMLWDILGQKDFTQTHESSVRGARGAILVYDVTRPETAASLNEFWLPLLQRLAGNVPRIVCGNKIDLAAHPAEETGRLAEIAQGFPAFLSSAKSGENVEQAFLALGDAMLRAPEEGWAAAEGGAAPAAGTLAAVTDRIIVDFCTGFGGLESGMPVVRQQFARAGLDINHPTKEGLRKAVQLLAEVEAGFRTPDEVAENRERRLAWLRDTP